MSARPARTRSAGRGVIGLEVDVSATVTAAMSAHCRRGKPAWAIELCLRVGGDHDDLAGPVGAPERLDGADSVADVAGDPVSRPSVSGTAQADQPHGATVTDDQSGCCERATGGARRLWLGRTAPPSGRDAASSSATNTTGAAISREPAAAGTGQ